MVSQYEAERPCEAWGEAAECWLPWPNDPDDDGNALAGVWHAVLIEAGLVTLVVLLVAFLHWLF